MGPAVDQGTFPCVPVRVTIGRCRAERAGARELLRAVRVRRDGGLHDVKVRSPYVALPIGIGSELPPAPAVY